jgi:hypothetical protein
MRVGRPCARSVVAVQSTTCESLTMPTGRAAIPFWGALLSVGGMALGAFGPWIKALGVSVGGTDGSNDGWIVVGAAALALLCLIGYARQPWQRALVVFSGLAGGAGAGTTIYDRQNISSKISDTEFSGLVQVGWGLNLAMVASIGLVVASLLLLRVDATRPESLEHDHEPPMYRECPHCREQMRRDASVCPHCRLESAPWTLHDGNWWIQRDGHWHVRDEQADSWTKWDAPATAATVESGRTAQARFIASSRQRDGD